MLKPFLSVLMLSIGLGVFAQQYSSVEIGKVTMVNKVDLTVTVDSSGTVILSTPTHNLYIDHPRAIALENALSAIVAGMRDLESKNITVVDYQVIGKLTNDGSRDDTLDGLKFRMEFNSTKNDKVLLLMYSTHNGEDMLFTTTAISQFDDLVKKALQSGVDYSGQYVYILSVIEKIDSTAF
jgi:hypothetical protein